MPSSASPTASADSATLNDAQASTLDDLFCLRCRYSLAGLTVQRCPECGEDLGFVTAERSPIAWEDRHERGVVRAYFQTAFDVAFRPRRLRRALLRPMNLHAARSYRRITILWAWLLGSLLAVFLARLPFGFAWAAPLATSLVWLAVLVIVTGAPLLFMAPRGYSERLRNRSYLLGHYLAGLLPMSVLVTFAMAMLTLGLSAAWGRMHQDGREYGFVVGIAATGLVLLSIPLLSTQSLMMPLWSNTLRRRSGLLALLAVTIGSVALFVLLILVSVAMAVIIPKSFEMPI